jgi:uncharacterized cupredoxin-like copper-binding protein
MTRGRAGSLVAVAVVSGGLAVAGAGVAATGTTAHLKADPDGALKFNKKKLTVSHGKVTVVMKNPSGSMEQHGIEVEGHGVEKRGKIVNPGKSSHVTFKKLKAGTYEFYCPVPGHKQAGMKGKLIVK